MTLSRVLGLRAVLCGHVGAGVSLPGHLHAGISQEAGRGVSLPPPAPGSLPTCSGGRPALLTSMVTQVHPPWVSGTLLGTLAF